MTDQKRKPAAELTPDEWSIRVERLFQNPEQTDAGDAKRMAGDIIHMRRNLGDIQTLAKSGLK
jgi:hypothetical protein